MDVYTQIKVIIFAILFGILLNTIKNIFFLKSTFTNIIFSILLTVLLGIIYNYVLYQLCFNQYSSYIIFATFITYFLVDNLTSLLINNVKKALYSCQNKIKMLYFK